MIISDFNNFVTKIKKLFTKAQLENSIVGFSDKGYFIQTDLGTYVRGNAPFTTQYAFMFTDIIDLLGLADELTITTNNNQTLVNDIPVIGVDEIQLPSITNAIDINLPELASYGKLLKKTLFDESQYLFLKSADNKLDIKNIDVYNINTLYSEDSSMGEFELFLNKKQLKLVDAVDGKTVLNDMYLVKSKDDECLIIKLEVLNNKLMNYQTV